MGPVIPLFARKEILKHITLARIAQPDSKRAGVAAFERDFGIKDCAVYPEFLEMGLFRASKC